DTDDSDDTDPDSGTDPDPDPVDCPDLEDREEVLVSGEIDEDTTWTCDNLYILTDLTFLVDGSTLTVEPGTVVQGDVGAALVSTVGSRLVAEGQANAPVVFTSSLEEGDRGPGDWGGLVLLGAAPINVSGGVDSVEGIASSDAAGEYGGDDEDHDCGSLEYVRVEFAGYEIATDNELNGISVAGC